MAESLRQGEYELAHQPLDPRDIELSINAATMLHDYLAQDYFPWVMQSFPRRKIVPELTEEHDVEAFASSIGYSAHRAELRDLEVSHFTGIRLTHNRNTWKVRALLSRYHGLVTDNKVNVRYAIDVEDSMVLQARVQAHVATADSDSFFDRLLTAEAATITGPTKVERKAYEKHMTVQDCFRLQRKLKQSANFKLAVG